MARKVLDSFWRGWLRRSLRGQVAVEGLAGAYRSIGQTSAEPVGAGGAGAVGPVFRAYGAAAHALQMVVADGGGGAEGSGDVVLVDDVALGGGVRPDAGEAVGLEFEVDGELISFARNLFRQPAHFALDAGELLDVVAEFVSENVGLGEVSRVAAHAFEVIPEIEIDVDLFIGWTIEGAGRGLGSSAAGVGGVAVEDKLRVAVLQALSGKDLGPGPLRVIEDEADQLGFAVIGGAGRRTVGIGGCGVWGDVRAAAAGEECSDVVLTGEEADDEQEEDADEADAAAAETASAAGGAPAIFYIGTHSSWCPVHGGPPVADFYITWSARHEMRRRSVVFV